MRTVTLQEINDRVRIYCDQRHGSFVNEEEMLLLMNDSYAELYDVITAAYANYYLSTYTFPVDGSSVDYALPDDFYKIIGVDFQIGGNQYCTLTPYPEVERNRNGLDNGSIPSGNIRLRYVPAPPVFTSLSDSFDGIAGWDRLLALAVAIDIMDAEESDTKALTRKYQQTLQRIMQMSVDRDTTMPQRVGDVYQQSIWNPYGTLMYRLYGNSINFVNTAFLGGPVFIP